MDFSKIIDQAAQRLTLEGQKAYDSVRSMSFKRARTRLKRAASDSFVGRRVTNWVATKKPFERPFLASAIATAASYCPLRRGYNSLVAPLLNALRKNKTGKRP
jgi:hypothetical protein